MTEQTLHIDTETLDATTCITPLGDIDLSKSKDLRAALHPIIKQNPDKIIVDLHAVPYMDSSGLATLIEALQLSKQANIAFILCGISEGVESIIALARLDKIFVILDNKEDAIAY
jgi:anti-sigma B factor antagonist